VSGTTGNSRISPGPRRSARQGAHGGTLEYRWLALRSQSFRWPLRSGGERKSRSGINRCRKSLFILAVKPLDSGSRGGSSLISNPIEPANVATGSVDRHLPAHPATEPTSRRLDPLSCGRQHPRLDETRERRGHHQHRRRVVANLATGQRLVREPEVALDLESGLVEQTVGRVRRGVFRRDRRDLRPQQSDAKPDQPTRPGGVVGVFTNSSRTLAANASKLDTPDAR